ncbi:MAG: phosphoribosyltransferase [Nanoarchaeota archaeon]|nr:phosphoribosyltransferase [Nanoarchaeota archaeon]
MKIDIPYWFDEELIPLLKKKLDRTGMKKRERTLDWTLRQMMKISPTMVTGMITDKFTWEDIENIIDENCNQMQYIPDAVIGIKSGGALIANYVAKAIQVDKVDYMYISHYSAKSQSVVKSTLTAYRNSATIMEEPIIDVKDKKILLVDDQTASGSTLRVGIDYFLSCGIKDVKTFCLYAKKGTNVDYCTREGLMVYTPWGKDA